MSRLLWIAVPGGAVTDGQATLRILIVPQLTEGTLKDNGLADWPAVLGHAELSVEVRQPDGSGSEVPYTLVSSGSSDVWQQFFSAVDVRGWQQPPAYDPPTVEPSTVQHDNIRKTYATSAKAVATPDVVHDQLASWHAGSPTGSPRTALLRRRRARGGATWTSTAPSPCCASTRPSCASSA